MSLSRPSAHLTALMRTALQDAARHNEGLRRTFDDKPGRPSWPAAPATLHALTRRGLLETKELRNRRGYRIQAWFITPEGRKALEPVLVVRRDVPLYLAPGGGYTTNPKRSIDQDLPPDVPQLVAVEALKGSPSPEWRENAERHRRRARADVNAARLSGLTHPEERLRELRAMAAQHGVDIRSDVRQVEHVVRRIERKVTGVDDRAA